MADIHLLIEELKDLIDEAKVGRHRVVRIRKGKRQVKWKCGPGWKSTPSGCKKIAGKERITRMMAQRKRKRKLKAKGAGFWNRVNRKRKKSLRRGSAMNIYHKKSSGSKPKAAPKKPKAYKPKSYKPKKR